MSESKTVEATLMRLIHLLEKAKEDNWVIYFGNALERLQQGNTEKAKQVIRRAYGGMCSFNDLGLNFITDKEYEEVLKLRNELWELSKPTSLIKKIFG
ncbi:DUF6966 domain-containing protein [Sulfuriroseicoccus oceanibius]|uniref:DUF6966 domain-containing protein n=1 Tax=Sulfuriroseicoccus oceanibius TaxID=2707525 RepID=A0A6B3LC20_9BACT|nr:hypothetical protein [Sulfuriroseicoccus oceanibius]QQL46200.1 hypothetical protein G3M56_006360 [Sulfuriroseicoccus oceanibius]